MDSRTAAHVLSRIAAYLELAGESRFKARAYESAARALRALDADDLAPLLHTGELAAVRGLGPATLSVVRDLVETGESRYLEQLAAAVPEGLLEMLRVPGLGAPKIHQIHEALDVRNLDDLEAAARDGRLASLPRFGPKTAERILAGIELARRSGHLALYHRAEAEGARLAAMVAQHPGVERVEIAGALRRRCEVVGELDLVAACLDAPREVIASFARVPAVSAAEVVSDDAASIEFVDGTRLRLRCARPDAFAVALCHATGSPEHLRLLRDRLAARGLSLGHDALHDAAGRMVPLTDEAALYAAAGLAWTPPELREGTDEIDAAARDALPALVGEADIRGVLHCHSDYSDGKATIARMAAAARQRGWSYLGISDHSQAAFYAGGMSRERVLAQHEEIDRVELSLREQGADFRVLKGIECDILADGRLDYDESLLDRFDYVIGSIHSHFRMDGAAMTGRVLRAMDDPHLTVLAHPTGRLLLQRAPYAIDMRAVLEKAAEAGVAVELNADPHRLDLDWRLLPLARSLGVTIEIGPDAHSEPGLDNVRFGVGVARKGWLEAADVLNAGSADDVLAFARRRRSRDSGLGTRDS